MPRDAEEGQRRVGTCSPLRKSMKWRSGGGDFRLSGASVSSSQQLSQLKGLIESYCVRMI